MSEYVIMPKADYTAACNAIRTKTGKADLIKSGDMEGEILGITSGGGSSADVRYVTFMNEDGSVELGKKAVATGDDCADPIARGVFSTPTKESTAQYTYTFYGWATTPNGAADSNWNKAVTEDRTVYANFVSAVRYYTVRFYDGGTLLTSKQVAYGGSSTYTPDGKDGYFFDTWEPAPTNITGDLDCYAQWKESVDFATATWKEIAEISAAGKAKTYFKIGDSKVVKFNNEDITIAIAGFDHDDLSDGSGKAGITCVTVDLPTTQVQYNSTNILFKSSNLYVTLKNWRYKLPADLYTRFKTVSKPCENTASAGATPTLTNVDCELFPLSIAEVGGTIYNTNNWTLLGNRYEYFPQLSGSYASPVAYVAGTTTKAKYWLRDIYRVGTARPVYAGTDGRNGGGVATDSLYVRFGFCI